MPTVPPSHGAVISFRRALAFSALWIALAVALGLWIAVARGRDDALAYFAAYLTEQSLSLDNMVVFVTIFSSFAVPLAYQRRVLSWGIAGAVVMRGAAVFAGAELLERLGWIRFVFGALLIVGALRLLRDGAAERQGGAMIARLQRVIPVTKEFHGRAFFWRENGRWAATPLFLALVVIELSDIVFATDSIPAVFAVTRDPFLVYSSNMLAVLGLRSLYFVVSGVIPRLRFLRFGLAAILVFVGLKMLLSDVVEVSVGLSLLVIGVAITVSVLASLWPRDRRVSGGI